MARCICRVGTCLQKKEQHKSARERGVLHQLCHVKLQFYIFSILALPFFFLPSFFFLLLETVSFGRVCAGDIPKGKGFRSVEDKGGASGEQERGKGTLAYGRGLESFKPLWVW